jgi:hypothetical protein
MNKVVLYFTEPETKLLDRMAAKTGLSYHDLIIRAVRANDSRHR